MKLKYAPAAVVLIVGLVLGQLAGMYTSDAIALSGYPHKKYVLSLKHDSTPESNFRCMQRGFSADNLSRWDEENKRQKDCTLLVTGEPLADGAFNIFVSTQTWYGRLWWGKRPVLVPADEIKQVRLAE